MATDGKCVCYEGSWYEKRGDLGRIILRVEREILGKGRPCKIQKVSEKELWARTGLAPEVNEHENRSEEERWRGVSEEGLRVIKGAIERGTLECASDASVVNQRKAVALWMGDRETEEGVMVVKDVRGYPHDSGRAELEGPVLAIETLCRLEEEYGLRSNTTLWCDNAEVVQKWAGRGVSKFTFKELLNKYGFTSAEGGTGGYVWGKPRGKEGESTPGQREEVRRSPL